MEKVVILFCICSLVNVILSTLKTLIMVNAGEKMAILINAVCYGFYTFVVKQLAEVDYATAVIVTILANIIGVWVSYRIMDLFKKDKLYPRFYRPRPLALLPLSATGSGRFAPRRESMTALARNDN